MKIIRNRLWDEEQKKAFYTAYLQDNSDEIEKDRRRPAIIVCGGGGYLGISDREKEPIALYFLNQGYQAIVLDYTTAKTGNSAYPEPVYDLAKMMLETRLHAQEWEIDADKIAIIGFSAGAHLCACLATQWQEDWLQERIGSVGERMRPNAVILSYPLTDMTEQARFFANHHLRKDSPSLEVTDIEDFMEEANRAMMGRDYTDKQKIAASPISHVTDQVPPVFLWHTATDEMVSVINSIAFAKELIEKGVDCELHVFEKGPHGMSLANRQSGGEDSLMSADVAVWKDLAVRFLERHF